MSPNSQVVHGIPNNKPLESGDVISVDCGAFKNGYHGDHAYSFRMTVAPETKNYYKLLRNLCTWEFANPSRQSWEDVGNAIQKYTEAKDMVYYVDL
jgi:methionyl aminopeptidase